MENYICEICKKEMIYEYRSAIPGTSGPGLVFSPCCDTEATHDKIDDLQWDLESSSESPKETAALCTDSIKDLRKTLQEIDMENFHEINDVLNTLQDEITQLASWTEELETKIGELIKSKN